MKVIRSKQYSPILAFTSRVESAYWRTCRGYGWPKSTKGYNETSAALLLMSLDFYLTQNTNPA